MSQLQPLKVKPLHQPGSAFFSNAEFDAARTQLHADADAEMTASEGAVIECHLVNIDTVRVQRLLDALHSICLDKQMVDARGRKLQNCFSMTDSTAKLQCLVPTLTSLSADLRDLSGATRTIGSSLQPGRCRHYLFDARPDDDLGTAAAKMAGLLQDENTETTQLQTASRSLQIAGSEYDQTPRSSRDMLKLLENNCLR